MKSTPDAQRPTPADVYDELGPERIFHYYDPASGMRAVLVIDVTRFGITAGGVRMAADLSLGEVVRLARAMTYKFAMLYLPCGGAKAGIWLDPADARRPAVIQAFLDALRPLLETRAYMAGADMGTSAHDFAAIYAAMGRSASLGEQIYDGLPLEDQLTGYGVVMAARAAAQIQGRSLRGMSVALEGFGKVGAGAAKYFAGEGARLVAISTIRGTLHDPNGLDVDRLLALRAEHGDAALERSVASANLLPASALYAVDADVLVPGARPDALNADIIDSVIARLIVPAANIPYADGMAARLATRGIVPLPDFVTNAGGVLTGLVEMQGGDAETAFNLVRERVASNVAAVLQRASSAACSAYEAGVAIARERLAETRPL